MIEFDNGAAYLYSYASAGRGNIETMKTLAAAGQGRFQHRLGTLAGEFMLRFVFRIA